MCSNAWLLAHHPKLPWSRAVNSRFASSRHAQPVHATLKPHAVHEQRTKCTHSASIRCRLGVAGRARPARIENMFCVMGVSEEENPTTFGGAASAETTRPDLAAPAACRRKQRRAQTCLRISRWPQCGRDIAWRRTKHGCVSSGDPTPVHTETVPPHFDRAVVRDEKDVFFALERHDAAELTRVHPALPRA